MNSTESPHTTNIVIVGDGIAAAVAAAALTRALPAHLYTITQVSGAFADPDDHVWTVAALPSALDFHSAVGLDEAGLVDRCGGGFALGTAYAGWSEVGAFFLPFGEVGASFGGVPFLRHIARLRADGTDINPCDYSLAAIMAQAGRFAHPSDDERSPLSTLAYGLHLPRRAYTQLLFATAVERGLQRVEEPFATSVMRNGAVEAVELSSGRRIHAGLFIDASGSDAALIGSLPGSAFNGWGQWLPCDRLMTLLCSTRVPPSPYSLMAAHAAGWRHSVPSVGHVSESVVYASNTCSDADAYAQISNNLLGEVASDLHHASFAPGRRVQLWQGNVVALGSAAAVLEPGSGLSLHLLHASALRLLKLIPVSQEFEAERREYNRLTTQELDCARDYAAAKYKLAKGAEPFWTAVRQTEGPETLEQKIRVFEGLGRVPIFDGDMFEEAEWALLFDSLGLRPERVDALAASVPADELRRNLARMRQLLIGAVKAVPPHADYLRQITARAAA